MKLITQRQLIQGVAGRWRKAYPPGRHGYGPDKDEILKRLESLDLSTVSAEEVNRIIGNDSWVTPECDECHESVPAVVEIGEEPHLESSTARICEACMRKAVALFDGGAP